MTFLNSLVNRKKTLCLRLRPRPTGHHNRLTRKSFGERSWRTRQWILLIRPFITLEPEAAAVLALPTSSIPMENYRPSIPTAECLCNLRSALPGCDRRALSWTLFGISSTSTVATLDFHVLRLCNLRSITVASNQAPT